MSNTLHHSYLKVFHFPKKVRCGVKMDGGYVIGDISGYDCYISAGVSNEESFTSDFIPMFGLKKAQCYAFDGTIDKYPEGYTKEIQFIRKNIGCANNDSITNLSFLFDKYNDIFLKMDIEGAEYDWINSLSDEQLKKIKQITIEFHFVNDDYWNISYDKKHESLKRMSNFHYLIHAHSNNWNRGKNNGIPEIIELTYIRKDCFEQPLEPNRTPLPIKGLDCPNDPSYPDLDLNYYPFVSS